jgi:hypothetical protein
LAELTEKMRAAKLKMWAAKALVAKVHWQPEAVAATTSKL